MSKIIRINKCSECPYWQCGWVEGGYEEDEDRDYTFHCGTCSRLMKPVKNAYEILKDCPLEEI